VNRWRIAKSAFHQKTAKKNPIEKWGKGSSYEIKQISVDSFGCLNIFLPAS
jgi:hypothetical protein